MIKMSYTSKILKQGYRVNGDDTLHKYFNDEMIGVPVLKESYTEDDATALDLIEKWNNSDKYHEYVLINTVRVTGADIPIDTFIHDSVFSGTIFKGSL